VDIAMVGEGFILAKDFAKNGMNGTCLK